MKRLGLYAIAISVMLVSGCATTEKMGAPMDDRMMHETEEKMMDDNKMMMDDNGGMKDEMKADEMMDKM